MPTKPTPQTTAGNTQASGDRIRVKKGTILFKEGDHSRSMYFLKRGQIRIYKQKDDAQIEIATIYQGAIIGELAFLDGEPRSASGEALVDCELMEVSGSTFVQTLQRAPDWLKLLLKTVVQRLRKANTRVRQLETASTAIDYSGPGGRSTKRFIYLSILDILKISSAILLVAARNGEKTEEGIELKSSLVERYGNNIIGIPVAKITSTIDIFIQVGIMKLGTEGDQMGQTFVKDIDLLEKFITYLNEYNLLEPSKRKDLSNVGFLVMGLIHKHLDQFPVDPELGKSVVNIADVMKWEAEKSGGPKFKIEDFEEVYEQGYAGQAQMKREGQILTQVDPIRFKKVFQMMKIMKAFEALNDAHKTTKKRFRAA